MAACVERQRKRESKAGSTPSARLDLAILRSRPEPRSRVSQETE